MERAGPRRPRTRGAGPVQWVVRDSQPVDRAPAMGNGAGPVGSDHPQLGPARNAVDQQVAHAPLDGHQARHGPGRDHRDPPAVVADVWSPRPARTVYQLRTGVLRAHTDWAGRAPVQSVEVSDHGAGCRAEAGGVLERSPRGSAGVGGDSEADARSADHSGRSLVAQDQPRRVAAAMERPGW